jgi:hypothetical protein
MGRGGRGRGGGTPDYDLLYDNLYSLQVFMPQGMNGTTFTFIGS